MVLGLASTHGRAEFLESWVRNTQLTRLQSLRATAGIECLLRLPVLEFNLGASARQK